MSHPVPSRVSQVGDAMEIRDLHFAANFGCPPSIPIEQQLGASRTRKNRRSAMRIYAGERLSTVAGITQWNGCM